MTLSIDGAWHAQHASDTFLQYFAIITHHFLFLQVYADDVLTKEEQIGLLFRAKRKCEGIIKAKHKIPGEQRNNASGAVLIVTAALWAKC